MANGKIKWFNPKKGYGFIEPEDGDKDVFIHISALEKAGIKLLSVCSPSNFVSQFTTNSKLSLKSRSSLGSSGSISSDCQKAIEEHELKDIVNTRKKILFIYIEIIYF